MVHAYDLACGLSELSCHSIAISIQLFAVNFTKGLIILIVSNIIARAIPSNVLYLCLLLGVKQGHHPIIELRIRLHKINDMKGVLPIPARISDLEVKPLSEILGAIVRFENEFVFILVNLYRLLQIPGFESRLKQEHIVHDWLRTPRWLTSILFRR